MNSLTANVPPLVLNATGHGQETARNAIRRHSLGAALTGSTNVIANSDKENNGEKQPLLNSLTAREAHGSNSGPFSAAGKAQATLEHIGGGSGVGTGSGTGTGTGVTPLRRRVLLDGSTTSYRSTSAAASTSTSSPVRYSSASSERTAARGNVVADRATAAGRNVQNKNSERSVREPYHYPAPVDFRGKRVLPGAEVLLPQFGQLQQASFDAAASAPPSPRFQTAPHPRVDPHSSSRLSCIKPGALDLRFKKLGDEYSLALIQEAMRILWLGLGAGASTQAHTQRVDEETSGIDIRSAGFSADGAVRGDDQMLELLSGVSGMRSKQLLPSSSTGSVNAAEEAYFDLSREMPLTQCQPNPLHTLSLRDNRLSDLGLARVFQCMQGRPLGNASLNSGSTALVTAAQTNMPSITPSGSGQRAVRQDRDRKIEAESNARLALSHLYVLDLSENTFRKKAAAELAQLLAYVPSLRHLKLEKMGLGDSEIRVLLVDGLAAASAAASARNVGQEGVRGGADGGRAPATSNNHNNSALKRGSALDEASIAGVGAMGAMGGFLLPSDPIPLPAALSIVSIDFSNNKISDPGCIPLAALIRSTHALRELNLSWNEIKDRGAVLLAGAVATNETLQKFDLSWNAIGTRAEVSRQVASALSDMLAKNHTLLHLDLSQNQLTAADCSAIAVGLAANHSVLGLHMTGNGGSIDAYGHLVPDAEPWPLESSHVMTRIMGENFQTHASHPRKGLMAAAAAASSESVAKNGGTGEAFGSGSSSSRRKVRDSGKWQLRNSCWICDCFREHKFEYILTQSAIAHILQSEPATNDSPPPTVEAAAPPKREIPKAFKKIISVKLLTSFDKWQPEEMDPIDNSGSAAYNHLNPHAASKERAKAKKSSKRSSSKSRDNQSSNSPDGSPHGSPGGSPGGVAGLSRNAADDRIKLKRNHVFASAEDQKACLLAASKYIFAAAEMRKQQALAASAAAAAADLKLQTNIVPMKKGQKAVRGDGKSGNAIITAAAQARQPQPPGKGGNSSKNDGHAVGGGKSPTKRRMTHVHRKKILRDPHVASISADAFKAKVAALQAGLLSHSSAGGEASGSSSSGTTALAAAAAAATERASDAFTHEQQHLVHDQEEREELSHSHTYNVDENDNWFAYFGGDTNPPPTAENEEEQYMAKLLGESGGGGGKRKTIIGAAAGNIRRPKFALHRMVPPGVHYYALSINEGPLTFDPFQPHVSTASLVAMGMYVPPHIQLPPFLNKLSVRGPTEEERQDGIEALITPLCQPRVKNIDAAKDVKQWTFHDSLFYGNIAKQESSFLGRCFFKDWQYTKASQRKVSSEVDSIERTLRRYYTLICAVFAHYAALYSTEMYFMGMGAFSEFIQRIKVIDGEQGRRLTLNTAATAATINTDGVNKAGSSSSSVAVSDATAANGEGSGGGGVGGLPMNGTCTRTEVELIFVSNCITGPRHEHNSKRALCRFQFLDCLVGVANVKFVKSGRCAAIGEALELLLENHVKAWAERERPPVISAAARANDDDDDDGDCEAEEEEEEEENAEQLLKPNSLRGRLDGEPLTQAGEAFRKRFLYTKECDTALRRFLPQLQNIFNRYSGEENTPLEQKTMSFKEWMAFTDRAGLQADEYLPERMIKLSYIRAKNLYEDCFDEENAFKRMTFHEFLECVVRSACACYLEKQRLLASDLAEGGSGMGKSASSAGLLRQDSLPSAKALVKRGTTKESSLVAVGAEAGAKSVGAVRSVADFLHIVEIIARKRV